MCIRDSLLTHWLQHNRIPRDRYRPTRHTALLSQVLLGDAREYIRWRRDPAPAAADPEADAAAPLDADEDALDALPALDSLDSLDAEADAAASDPAAPLPASDVDPEAAARCV